MGFIASKEKTMNQKRTGNENHQKSYGSKLGYSIFQFVLKNIGLNWAYGILVFLVPYYVFFRPGVYRLAKPYLQRRFPEDSAFARYFRLFQYIFVFGRTLIDQYYFGLMGDSKVRLDFEREAEVLEILNQRPVIFLMSHVGFWEFSMAGSVRFNKRLNVLVNQEFDKDKRKSFYDIQEHKFHRINVTDPYGGMIEATNVLLRGEVLGVTGDRAEQWRSKSTTFLGSPAQFPIIAQQLALATGASVIALFTSKAGKYQVRIRWKDISTEVLSDTKLDKDQKIQKMLELYAAELERHVQEHPYLWFNFFDFWKR